MNLRVTTATMAVLGLCCAADRVSGQTQTATYTWNFTDGDGVFDTVTTSAIPGLGVGSFTIGNTLGVVATPINSTSSSTGTGTYAGASGTNNIGNAVKIGALDTSTSSYYQLVISTTPSTTVSLVDFDFGTRSTGTGPQAYALRSSSDNFANDITTGAIASNSAWAYKDNTFSTADLTTDATGNLTLRLYTFAGTGSPSNNTINSRLDDISVTITATPTPEPATGFGLAALGLGVVAGVRRRFRKGEPATVA